MAKIRKKYDPEYIPEAFDSLAERKRSNCFLREIKGRRDECVSIYLDGQQVFPRAKSIFPVHVHQSYEMIIPRRTYHCELNKTPLTVDYGNFLIVQPDDQHLDYLTPEEPYYSFRFNCAMLLSGMRVPRILKDGIAPELQVAPIVSSDAVMQLIELHWNEVELFSGGRFNVCDSIFQAIFWKCVMGYPHELLHEYFIQDSHDEFQLRRVMAVFEQNRNNMPDIPLFCRQTGMSRSSLARFCHAYFNMPAAKAFMRYKMNYAQRRLRDNPELKIKELSEELGFTDQFHFSKTFKRFFGYNPSEC